MRPVNIIREIHTPRFVVEIGEYPEHIPPEDTIASGDDSWDAEYVEHIRSGDYPWYCLGVVVRAKVERAGYVDRAPELGASFLGCVDTYDTRAVGVADMVREAIADARHTLATLNS